jgi:hypothetical protein
MNTLLCLQQLHSLWQEYDEIYTRAVEATKTEVRHCNCSSCAGCMEAVPRAGRNQVSRDAASQLHATAPSGDLLGCCTTMAGQQRQHSPLSAPAEQYPQ